MPIRRPMGFREQLLGIVLLSFALLMYVSSDTYLRQLPAGIWPAMLFLALVALRRPETSPPIPGLNAVKQAVVRRSSARIKVVALPVAEAETASETVRKRQWQDAVDEIDA
jgi:hypothetical protein